MTPPDAQPSPHHPHEPHDPHQPPAWTPDPARWARGDWAFNPGDWQNDATKDADWEDPSILRRKIGTDAELQAIADAIVRRYEITEAEHTPEGTPTGKTRVIFGKVEEWWFQSHSLGQHVVVENLKALIEAVQVHPDVRLAKVELEFDKDNNGYLRVLRRWMEDGRGNKLPDEAKPTELYLWQSVVAGSDSIDEHYEDYPGMDIGVSLQIKARIGRGDVFYRASFAAEARFGDARFTEFANFNQASFAGGTEFTEARFAGIADFGFAQFTRVTDFKLARFARDAWFGQTRFAGEADFCQARFAGVAGFGQSRFGGEARFWEARFDGEAMFREARFAGEASFGNVRVPRKARLHFVGASFARRVRFDGDRKNTRPLIRGKVFFTDVTLDERLTFDHTRFGKHARLGFSNFLARGGATIELSEEQLRLTNPVPSDRPLERWWWRLRGWFTFHDRSRAIMEGGDSTDPDPETRADEIDRAADDYELLAANYARQPARDDEEDGCRWMAHELHRRAGWIRSWHRTKAQLRAPLRLAPRAAPPRVPGWVWDPIDLIGRGLSALDWLVMLLWWPIEHVFARWLLQRTAVGYLLDWWRPLVSGVVVIVVFAVLYGLGANPDTIFYSDDPAAPLTLWLEHPVGNPLYFSVVTFTSLGYGDIQPKGWFKFLTAAEALTGVTLMALFTVSWGRKMIR